VGQPGRQESRGRGEGGRCRWIYPLFAAGERHGFTDFNDLHLEEGLGRVREQVGGAFTSVEAEDAAPGATIVEFEKVQDESWRQEIPRTSSGQPDGANVEGVAIYIAKHRKLCRPAALQPADQGDGDRRQSDGGLPRRRVPPDHARRPLQGEEGRCAGRDGGRGAAQQL
jgi:hypothetical protein